MRTWGEWQRDPRWRIITTSYLALVEGDLKVQAADDAKDAQWLDIDLKLLSTEEKEDHSSSEIWDCLLYTSKAALIFLIKLGIGWVIGFGASVMVLSSLFQAHIYEISSVFLGLTLFAIPLVVKEEWDSIHGKAGCLIFTLAGTVLVFCISYFNTSNRDGISVNFEHLTVGLGLYLFFAAMVAITAMVLPGISGSTLLLIFGLYVPVINAIHEFMHLNFSYFPVLVIFGLGVLTGIIAITVSYTHLVPKAQAGALRELHRRRH